MPHRLQKMSQVSVLRHSENRLTSYSDVIASFPPCGLRELKCWVGEGGESSVTCCPI